MAAPVFADLVGQQEAIAIIERAVRGARGIDEEARESGAMTHAWLFTGPPGSGRSNAARAFAAALLCSERGCGECATCREVYAGTHADVELMESEGLSIKADQIRELIVRAAWAPAKGSFRVVIIEDADKLTETAANALLKAIEEPGSFTTWFLCAPSPSDVLPTIRSRCRSILLRTPSHQDVATVLIERDGVDPTMAAHVARASQGHVGRAKWLAFDEDARKFRHDLLAIPARIRTVGEALSTAAELHRAATEESVRENTDRDEREMSELSTAWGHGATGKGMPSGAAKAIKELEKTQKSRTTARNRAFLDIALLDLATFYRDVLLVQAGAEAPLINEDLRATVTDVASQIPGEGALHRVEAIMGARKALAFNVAPLLALESMMLALRLPARGGE